MSAHTLLSDFLHQSIGARIPVTDTREALHQWLSNHCNHLLQHDFSALVQLLYRTDVPEAKLKTLLQQHPHEDAGQLIATLMVERIEQIIEARRQYTPPYNEASNEEPW